MRPYKEEKRMAHAMGIEGLNKMVAEGLTQTLLDVRRESDCAAAPQTIATARWCDPEPVGR
jgi:hypothetical protein